MGCCVSSGKSSPSPYEFDQHSAAAAKISRVVAGNGSREPPTSMEEETVKEVLSETPSQKPKIKEDDEIEKKIRTIPTNVVAEHCSEVSAISSLSESLSTATYTDRMDDGEEVHQRICRSSPVKIANYRSNSGNVWPKKELSPNRALTRRSDQSPGRRNGPGGSGRLVQSKDVGQSMVRRGVRAEAHRRDPGEISSRRSRSPATARTDGGASRSGLGRTPSARKSGNSPGRVAMAPIGSSQKVAEEPNFIEGKLTSHSESLENPLVSLECFIFL